MAAPYGTHTCAEASRAARTRLRETRGSGGTHAPEPSVGETLYGSKRLEPAHAHHQIPHCGKRARLPRCELFHELFEAHRIGAQGAYHQIIRIVARSQRDAIRRISAEPFLARKGHPQLRSAIARICLFGEKPCQKLSELRFVHHRISTLGNKRIRSARCGREDGPRHGEHVLVRGKGLVRRRKRAAGNPRLHHKRRASQ